MVLLGVFPFIFEVRMTQNRCGKGIKNGKINK